MRTLSMISSLVAIGLGAGCGGKSKATTDGASGGGGDALPWEATLTAGARFELAPMSEDDGGPIAVTVTAAERDGTARIYTLQWGEAGNGPTSIRVDHGVVTIGDAEAKAMLTPWTEDGTGATCYAADFSNPEGCDDVCDASLCISATAGITSVGGVYAPNFGMYHQR